MREYYGCLEDCSEYIQNKNHKAVVWKEHPFSFELKNSTKYTLGLKRERISGIFATVEPGESIQIHCDGWGDGEIRVFINRDFKCRFCVGRGCMIERNFVDTMEKGKIYIAPIFKQGIVEIVTCTDCSPNFGIIPKYDVKPLQSPANVIKVTNKTGYNIIISNNDGTVVQRIESRKTEELGVPAYGYLYIDTETEEVKWQCKYNILGKKILRVNGCCIEIRNGKYYQYHGIVGPEIYEPYIRHLYVTEGYKYDDDTGISVWCNTIDYRLD